MLAITGARFAYEVFVIARSTEWTTRQSIVYWDILSKARYGYYVTVDRHAHKGLAMTRVILESALRLLRVSGSPRAFSPRDDKDDVCA